MRCIVAIFFSCNLWAQDFLNIELLAQWSNDTLIVGPGNVKYSDLWGFIYNEKKYAVVGSTEGSHFLQIKKNHIEEVDFELGAFSSLLVQHRDYKRYRNYIYGVCDEGESSLQIFDMSYLPDSVHKVYDSNEHFTICHNIFIDTSRAKLYACGPNNTGLKILDISIPEQPKLLSNFNQVNYVHDCFVRNDTAFLNTGPDGLKVYNFANSNSPIEIGALSNYQEQGYNHSGWLDNSASTYCFIDETPGKKIKFCELNEGIENIKVDALFGTKSASNYVAHNIQIFNDFAFVSYYNEGLRVFDLTASPIKEVAHFDTYPIESEFKLHGAWGVYVFEKDQLVIVSDRQGGVFSFYYPFNLIRKAEDTQIVAGTPFINSESTIILPHQNAEELFFEIYSISGNIIFSKQRMLNWLNIPLNLISGQYVYKVFSEDNKVNYSGKFVITH